jgi:hypothetical protein
VVAQQNSGPISVPTAQYDRLDVYVVAGDGFTQTFSPGVGLVTQVNAANVPLQIFVSHFGGATGIVGSSVPNFAADPVGVEYLVDGLDLTGPAGAGFTDFDDAAIFRFSYDLGGTLHAPTDGLSFFNAGLANGQLGDPQAGPLYIIAATLDVSPVPEPMALLPLALAGAGAALSRRRRVRRA